MKTKSQKQHSDSQSGKKAQVMSVDSSVSYFLFALFLIYMSNFIINISRPYSSYINYEELYKITEAISNEFRKQDINTEYLNTICENNYTNVISTRADYEIKALLTPANDAIINNTKQGIHLRREDNKITTYFNTNQTTNLDLIILTKEDVSVTSTGTEAEDNYNQTRSTDTVTLNFNITNTNEDTDTYEITLNEETIIFINYYTTNPENIYVGITPFSYTCGDERNLAKKSYYSSYAVLGNTQTITSYGVEVWWE